MSNYLTLGLLGHPLSHSLSPVLHTAALRYAGLPGQYRLFDVLPSAFADGFANMLEQGVTGFNITVPYKQRICSVVHYRTKESLQAGAINTVKVEPNGKLSGHNTDIIGFELAFRESFHTSLQGRTALVIGAGGAARAVIVALNRLHLATIKVKARDASKVSSFIADLQTSLVHGTQGKYAESVTQLTDDAGQGRDTIAIVINASPIGLTDDNIPSWLETLMSEVSDDCLCFDLVYRKDASCPAFSNLARKRQLCTVDGLSMLIHQARFAFEYWTGVSVPGAIMYQALDN